MYRITFIVIAIILIAFIFYFIVKRKIKCSHCKSSDVTATEQKRYREDNLAIHGSPNSSYEIGYKCNKCGNTFWEPKQAAIFN